MLPWALYNNEQTNKSPLSLGTDYLVRETDNKERKCILFWIVIIIVKKNKTGKGSVMEF